MEKGLDLEFEIVRAQVNIPQIKIPKVGMCLSPTIRFQAMIMT